MCLSGHVPGGWDAVEVDGGKGVEKRRTSIPQQDGEYAGCAELAGCFK